MEESIDRSGSKGEGIIELAGGALEIESFTNPDVRYKVHPDSGYCTCPRYQHTGRCVKHPVFAEAIQRVRERHGFFRWFGKASTEAAEEEILSLCRRIFEPVKYNNRGYPDQHPIDSYNLELEVFGFRHSTERMKKEAKRRHGRILIAIGRQDGYGSAA